jgi:2-oxoglutarate dehydrogenase E2 component (dihydrolipoamide succinyltransferase)
VHALVAVDVDYSAVDRARSASAARGRAYTYLPFVARATVAAIRRYPEVNAVLDDDQLVVRRAVNLGIAVDLDHNGLVVPVIPDADTRRLDALADHVHDVAQRARTRKLTPDDVAGGTFTITNAGRYGTLVTGPIIHLPQVAILSMNGVRPTPVAVEQPGGGYAVGVHPVGSLSLSFDHRAFDGAYASAFLAEVRDVLQGRDWEAEL